MARVVYRDENYQTFYVDVNDQQPEVTIGRNQGNMILIPAKSLSRYHAKIVYQNRRYFLIDLKSSNGTYVNNVRINQQEIHPGDLIRFGEVSVDFVDDNRNAFAGPMSSSAGQSMAHPPMSSVGAPMNSSAPMPPQRPAMPPSMPPGPGKMSSPKIQMFNPGIQPTSSGPDLRSVSMRPISSGGTYRPTMPNQPAFDDSMAKMAEQIASPVSPVAPTMDAAAAPATFDPNSMGMRPQPPQRNLVTPGNAPSMNPFVPPQKGIDPAAPPMSFNPGSMGIKPMAPRPLGMNAPEMPGPNKFMPPAPGGIDPGVAPMTFNPNSMGLMQTPPSVDAGAPSIGGVPTAGPASMNSGVGSIPSGMMPAAAGVTAPSGGLDAFSHDLPDSNENSRFPGMSGVTAPSGLNASKNLISVSTLDPEQNTALHKVEQKEQNEDSVSPALEQIANELDSASNHAESHEDDKNENSEAQHHAPMRSPGDAFSPSLSGISRRAARPNGFNRPSVSDVIPVPASAGMPSMPASSGSFSRQGRGVPGRTRMSTHFSPRSDSADNSQLPLQDDSANNEIHSGLEIPPQMNLDPVSSEAEDKQENKKIDEMNAGDFLPSDLPDSEKSLAMEFSEAVNAQQPQKDAAGSENNADAGTADASAESKVSHPSMASPKISAPVDAEMFDELRHSLDIEAISCDSEDLGPVGTEIQPEADAAPEESQESQESSQPIETQAPESPVSQGDAQAASEASAGASSEEVDKMRAQRDSLQEQLDDANQMVKLLNAAMAELKEVHQTQLGALKTQNEEAISQLNVEHLQELSLIKADSERSVSEVQSQMDALQTENESLKARIAEMEKTGGEAGKFVPKWSSRFDALIQYAKAMERAVDKLQLDSVEPKAFEYIRSMSDMIRFCADDLKSR